MPRSPRDAAFLHERYLPSGLVPAQNGLGLWVERDHFRAFEQFPAIRAGSSSEPRRGIGQGPRMVIDGELVAVAKPAHDGVPALAERVSSGLVSHGPQPVGLGNECKNGLGEAPGGSA